MIVRKLIKNDEIKFTEKFQLSKETWDGILWVFFVET